VFKIGKQVAVLDDVLRGVIIDINNEVINIKDVDGMIYQFNQNELVIIEQDQHQLSKYSDINNPLLKDKLKEQDNKGTRLKKDKNEVILEVDLHINQLIKTLKGWIILRCFHFN